MKILLFDYNKFWGVNAATKMGGFGLTAGYDKFTNSKIWIILMTMAFGT
jgi:hypothetical protein